MNPPPPVLSLYNIDKIMFKLDSLSRRELQDTDKAEDGSRFFQCFGVFESNSTGSFVSVTQATPPSQSKDYSVDETPSSHGLESQLDSESLRFSQPPTDSEVHARATFHHAQATTPPDHRCTNSTSTHDVDEWSFFMHDSDIFKDLDASKDQKEPWESYLLTEPYVEPVPRSPPVPDNVSHHERFLMHHYTSKVVHLFGVLQNTKGPWQTIHVPRALQSAGELAVHGTTPPSKNALRNALLSISAFSISNEYKTQSRVDEAQMWTRAATSFRAVAIKYLNEAVEGGFSNKSRLKYKECLATMLSMISINVMSGDTATCGAHLEGTYRIICQARNWKSKYSKKARALHRIYFFLRTIYESTRTKSAASNSCNNGDPMAVCVSLESLSDILPDCAPKGPGYPAPGYYSLDACGYAHIYAIPHDLLILLARTVEVVNLVVEERERTGTRALSSQLTSKCDEMETSIMDWLVDPLDDPRSTSSISPTNSDIMEHMTRAFHNAIIIYFAQHVRLFEYRYLQPFVVKVIESIEAVERVKSQDRILAAPLWWPAFIAASEAFDAGLQERFRTWYSKAEVYGFGCMRTDYRVLSKVWEQGPYPRVTLTSMWRTVVKNTGDVLLLS